MASFPEFREEWIVSSGYDDGKIFTEYNRSDLPYKGWIDVYLQSGDCILEAGHVHTAIVNRAGFRKSLTYDGQTKKNTTHDYYRRFRDYINFDTGEIKTITMQLFQKVLLNERRKNGRTLSNANGAMPLSKLGVTRVSDFGSDRCLTGV